jgi:hypothetical protein
LSPLVESTGHALETGTSPQSADENRTAYLRGPLSRTQRNRYKLVRRRDGLLLHFSTRNGHGFPHYYPAPTYLPDESREQIRRLAHDQSLHQIKNARMEDQPAPPIERRVSEMLAAREEWRRASRELGDALALFRDLNSTRTSSDGDLALRNARLRESSARKRYVAAVQLYAQAIRRSR